MFHVHTSSSKLQYSWLYSFIQVLFDLFTILQASDCGYLNFASPGAESLLLHSVDKKTLSGSIHSQVKRLSSFHWFLSAHTLIGSDGNATLRGNTDDFGEIVFYPSPVKQCLHGAKFDRWTEEEGIYICIQIAIDHHVMFDSWCVWVKKNPLVNDKVKNCLFLSFRDKSDIKIRREKKLCYI